MQSPQETADLIFHLYQKYGAEMYNGEPVTQLEHMYQAAKLAEAKGYDDEVILAAFFHDIGYLVKDKEYEQMQQFGHAKHEQIGAEFLLSQGFSPKIAKLVEQHVAAKRYLTYKYLEYREQLSDASKQTLVHQGGPMNETEATAFETDPLFEQIIDMRKWDEEAKVENYTMLEEDFNRYKAMAVKHLQQRVA